MSDYITRREFEELSRTVKIISDRLHIEIDIYLQNREAEGLPIVGGHVCVSGTYGGRALGIVHEHGGLQAYRILDKDKKHSIWILNPRQYAALELSGIPFKNYPKDFK